MHKSFISLIRTERNRAIICIQLSLRIHGGFILGPPWIPKSTDTQISHIRWPGICSVSVWVFCFRFIFFMWTIFLEVFIEFGKYCFSFMFWGFGPETCGILAAQSRMKPALPELESEVLTSGHAGAAPR